MSNYYRPAYHPPTGTVRDALWADDYFGKHQYAVLFEGDETAYRPEQVEIPRDKVFVPQEPPRSEKVSSAVEGPENSCRYPNCVDESEDQRCPDWLTGDCPGPDAEEADQ